MAPPDPARIGKDKAISFDVSTMLIVVVGKEPNEKRFLVHEGFVCARSAFFQRAMNGPWAERDERIIKLPEDDPEVFAIYVNFVYTNTVATGPLERPIHRATARTEYMLLSKLYVLCEKLCDIAAKNAVLQAIRAVSSEVTDSGEMYIANLSAVQIIYAGTPKGSLGRRLMADMWTGMVVEHLVKCGDEMPREFLLDMVVAHRRDRPSAYKNIAKRAGVDAYWEVK
ncbi:hypothetical protein BKA63DRAFT_13643 [Paraphoma chrysanthemicola]|nr:hypothetical protein BKA63DRAFT_13643 [Paraphoma chrysanthemicola]